MREWLVTEIKDAGFTISQVGRMIGVSKQTMSMYISGKRRPLPEHAKRIGNLLGFSWTRFYDETDD